MKFRKQHKQHILAVLFGMLLGLSLGWSLFNDNSDWLRWVPWGLTTIGLATVSLGISLARTRGDAWGVLTAAAGTFLMGFAFGINSYYEVREMTTSIIFLNGELGSRVDYSHSEIKQLIASANI